MKRLTTIIPLLVGILMTGCQLAKIGEASIPTLEVTRVSTATGIEATSNAEVDDAVSLHRSETPSVIQTEPAPPDGEALTLAEAEIDVEQFVLPECNVQRPDWPIYLVRRGDTLAALARSVNSTVAILAEVNCLADPNRIYVGQPLHLPSIPVEPLPTIPVADIGAQPAHVCVVVPNGYQANIYREGNGGVPVALLVGQVRFVRQADNAYVVEVPNDGLLGWVSAAETHLQGTSCPGAALPPTQPGTGLPSFGNAGDPPLNSCSVVALPEAMPLYLYGPGDGAEPIGTLTGWLPLVAIQGANVEVTLPGKDYNVWISADDIALIGSSCPERDGGDIETPIPPNDLPVISNGSPPAKNVCNVVRDQKPGYRYIYGGSSDAHAPIAIMGDYLLYLAEVNGGYEVVLPGWDMTGWVPAYGVELYGDTCPS